MSEAVTVTNAAGQTVYATTCAPSAASAYLANRSPSTVTPIAR